ncbi:hypothetical protein F4678DRAFT_484931 [Xylaria arbuscula]|nr:hypothetical protein F4678DRAFT_484931 [Xylaria arbuscula]
MLKAALLFSLLSAAPGSANGDVDYIEYVGTGYYLSNPDNYTRNLIDEGRQHPNATRSVNFKPFAVSQDGSSADALKDEEWTWRVNVSDFAVPNAESGANVLVDPHVVDTQYDLTWPKGGNLTSALPSRNDSVCFQNIGIFGNPANVSNAYTDDNTNSTDCTPVLGAECVSAIVDDARLASADGRCNGPLKSWFQIPACASTFGYTYNENHDDTMVEFDYNATSLHSGEAFWGTNSAAFNGSNATVYESAANALQVMIVAPIVSNVSYPQLLCMRVNTTHLDVPGGAGSLLQYNSGVVMATALFWVLAAVYAENEKGT